MSLLSDMVERLALGTVQFGLKYGISNHQVKVPFKEAKSIIELANSANINTLDTAVSYGDSEKTLGSIGVSDWNIISKLPNIPDECDDVKLWLNNEVTASLKRLNINCLNSLLLHNPQQLFGIHGSSLYKELTNLKDSGKVKKIGISIYNPSELDQICKQFEIDIVQAPLNLVDNRLVESGWLNRLSDLSIEIHARSIFLQGLLLMPARKRPQKFNQWASLWTNWDKWLNEISLTPLQACLQYVLSFKEINKVIVGVDSVNQLENIILSCNSSKVKAPKNIHCSDVNLVNPSHWQYL